eukprot:6197286-Pleurochrysis_carterae.AAC.5
MHNIPLSLCEICITAQPAESGSFLRQNLGQTPARLRPKLCPHFSDKVFGNMYDTGTCCPLRSLCRTVFACACCDAQADAMRRYGRRAYRTCSTGCCSSALSCNT